MAIRQLPYGISDFQSLRLQDRYCIDKTSYIEKLEWKGNFLFLIRPRRFGKSLFLSMLMSYYDIRSADRFDTLFDGMWIHSHPTALKNKYQILYLDFSRASSGNGTLEENFNRYCSNCLDVFATTYERFYHKGFAGEIKALPDAASKLNVINMIARNAGNRLYLIIDEYDNFTNDVLNTRGEDVYHAMTHAEGFYRNHFKLYKGMFERILMMGVSPVTLDDLTSGYNIATNISLDPAFNTMLGFSEDEVREMIEYYRHNGLIQAGTEEIINDIRPWYDNYCFARRCFGKSHVFNCDMVIYYLSNLIQNGEPPVQMIDPNTRTDYNKMKRLVRLDKLDGNRKGIIREITNNGYLLGELADHFPATDIMKPDIFPSLLFYYGMLTITGTHGIRLKLGIPNENVRRQLYGYMLEDYQLSSRLNLGQLSDFYDSMALDGQWEGLCRYIAEGLHNCTSIHSSLQSERNIQGFFAAYMNENRYYNVRQEMEFNHGYCDMVLMPDLTRFPEVKHCYLIEFKYLKTNDASSLVEERRKEARSQLLSYAADSHIQTVTQGTQLHLLIIIFKGDKIAGMEEI